MDTISLFERALLLVVMVSAPPLVIVVIIGILISLLQTLFQIQDQTLPFSIKLIAMTMVLSAIGGWMGGEVYNLANTVFEYLPYVGKQR